MTEPSEELKQFFVEAAKRRKELGIKLGKWEIRLDRNVIEAVDTLWESWVRALGKRRAEDNLLEAMTNQHELIRRRLEYEKENHSGRPHLADSSGS